MTSRQRRDEHYHSSSSSTSRRDAYVSVSATGRSRSLTATSQATGALVSRIVGTSGVDGAARLTDGTAATVQAGYEAVFECGQPEGLDSRYTCPVCLATLRQPIQTKCGHRFCNSCFRSSIAGQRQAKCPVDKTVLISISKDVFNDLAMEREVLSLAVKCNNCAMGCEWRGELRQLEEHLRRCGDAVVFCNNAGCAAVYKRTEHEVHQRECSRRIQPCVHCGTEMISLEMAKHQLLSCSRFPVTCGQCGELGIVREDIPRHCNPLTGTCPMSVVSCQFVSFGCTFQDARKNMTAHLQSQTGILQHLNMVRIYLERLAQEPSNHHSQQQQQEQEHGVHQSLSILAAAESGSPIGSTHLIPRDGRLLWKISLVLDTSMQPLASSSTPRSYRSPSFYTANIGYKVHLVFEIHAAMNQPSSVEPEQHDGPETGRELRTGTSSVANHARRGFEPHCSIFISLEPGRFDEFLRFPLDGSLTVTLINQADNPDDRVDHKAAVVFHDLPRVFQQDGGQSDDTRIVATATSPSPGSNIRRGRLRLISLRRLYSCPFVRDDVLFVQAEVNHLLPFRTVLSAPVS